LRFSVKDNCWHRLPDPNFLSKSLELHKYPMRRLAAAAGEDDGLV
jgi:hypothetical protein